MKQIIPEMGKLCAAREPFALATVISRNGSAPRSAGAKMLVKTDGKIIGTVGGGILEAQVQRLAAQSIAGRRATIQAFAFDGKDAATMDAICGGKVEVLVEWIDPTDPNTAELIQGLQAVLARHLKAWWITLLPAQAASTSHILVQADGQLSGVLPPGLALESILDARLLARVVLDPMQAIIEPIQISGSALIFGAGHVSRSLAGFARAVGFWTVVLDDRVEYANRERFPEADEIIVLDLFSDWVGQVPVDRDSLLVIVTRGHQNDLTVLAQALKLDAGYIGMIGSRRKCELIFQELRRMGFSEADIQRVHAPIGLPISAETPEEIGVSIVAEMIQARAGLQRQQ